MDSERSTIARREWYQDNHPSDLAILRFASDHTISYYEVESGNGYDGDVDMCDEYTYDSSSKEIKLNCEHTMRMVHYEDTNKLTVMVNDEKIVYYNSEELLNQ